MDQAGLWELGISRDEWPRRFVRWEGVAFADRTNQDHRCRPATAHFNTRTAAGLFRSHSPITRRSRSHPFSREPQRWDCRRLCRWREKHYNSSAMRKLIFSLLLLASSALAQTAPQFDVLIRNG